MKKRVVIENCMLLVLSKLINGIQNLASYFFINIKNKNKEIKKRAIRNIL